ncbi:centrosome-associated protein CEP250-like [Ochlerotatus camptorhynchus]|uniref:centrosome-associated protein CEP250-like n=1 Tax=Ochlerotatus camptorhynchus TaxID=644619 RepID=UPI0031DA1F82
MDTIKNRPLTLSEYSTWLQLICAESAMVSQASEHLTARAERIARVNETLVHRTHEARLKSKELEQEITELEKSDQSVRECLAEMEARLEKLKEKNLELKNKLAEVQQPTEAATKGLEQSEERLETLEAERRKLMFLKRIISQSINAENVWNVMPAILQEDKLRGMVEAAASDISSWEEVLRS